ncbi:MAG TPA: hypothetical protein VIT23_01035, partial [Terrimicrobiaceae bacterium]
TSAALFALVGLGSIKLWTTVRDIERLGLNRMAREDSAILTVPDVHEVHPVNSGVPETPSGPGSSSGQGGDTPSADVPVSRSRSAGAESALLVGADVSQENHLR